MPRKSYTVEQVTSRLREAEVLLGQGQTVGDVCRSFNITEQTYYRWRKEYGGIRTDQVRRLKELERENTRLKKLVADLSLDNSIFRETVRGN
jgi:putative transposase